MSTGLLPSKLLLSTLMQAASSSVTGCLVKGAGLLSASLCWQPMWCHVFLLCQGMLFVSLAVPVMCQLKPVASTPQRAVFVHIQQLKPVPSIQVLRCVHGTRLAVPSSQQHLLSALRSTVLLHLYNFQPFARCSQRRELTFVAGYFDGTCRAPHTTCSVHLAIVIIWLC